ncbi:small ribosomal subunit protein mS26-like [Physella acuta]|uniref:small ribosomal subunit protein mS26-like n=1 Tax=Physella acuta TaxID=109671 RepID=UPI0027DD7194|nr:small ribosomal subunit protein mS26-like [Physella acuta]XP_059145324.1 small ribosomal subunit protein mS26-like [Physella acuta]
MSTHLYCVLNFTVKNKILNVSTLHLIKSVRFRKPRWVPIAKSKEFYVRKPTPIDPVEYDMLNTRYNLYRAEVLSIRQFLKQQLSESAVNLKAQQKSDDAADVAWMAEQVKSWNKLVAVNREARQVKEMQKEEKRIAEFMAKKEENRLKVAKKAEILLLKNKEISSNFITDITKDKLDEEIERLLDSRSDYNFAITKTGQILKGEYPDTTVTQDSTKS